MLTETKWDLTSSDVSENQKTVPLIIGTILRNREVPRILTQLVHKCFDKKIKWFRDN